MIEFCNPTECADPASLRPPPEQHLWLSVLRTFIEDVGNHGLTQTRANHLLNQASTEWAEMICDLAGIDYEAFMTKLITTYRDAAFTRRWNAHEQ